MAADASWNAALRDGSVSGAAASIASALVLALAGKRELADAPAPLNGPSQWIWGKHAPYRDGFSVRHTVTGYAIHHAAATLWALLYERSRRSRDAHPLAVAAATSLVAAVVDFRLTPERFTPGFQKRLSKGAIVAVYAAFALGLALPALAGSRRSR
ncbi:MAG TPA: hypothetical protein VM122_06200 [Usitatibacter sp.]|nr:hypothetical protein [Usitatibacter sp.]